MKKGKAKHIIISDDLYKAEIHVFINCTQATFNKFLKKHHGVDGDDEPCGGAFKSVHCSDGTKTYYIWSDNFNWRIAEQGQLLHEVFHCAKTIFEDRNIEVTSNTEENFAYYQTWLFEEIYKKLLKGDKK